MNKKKKILILGVTGQDGSFLAKFLVEKKFSVHGLIRKSATGNLDNIRDLLKSDNFSQHHGDLLDLIVSSDSGIPLFMRTGDGNESDKAVFGQILSDVKKQIIC